MKKKNKALIEEILIEDNFDKHGHKLIHEALLNHFGEIIEEAVVEQVESGCAGRIRFGKYNIQFTLSRTD